MNIALRRFLHNHGNIATEVSPKPGLYPTLRPGNCSLQETRTNTLHRGRGGGGRWQKSVVQTRVHS